MSEIADICLKPSPINFKKLHFYNNMSGEEGAAHLVSILKHQKILESLRFSGTRAGYVGSTYLVEGLEGLGFGGSLKWLDFGDNTFSGENGEKISKLFQEVRERFRG